MAQKRQSYPKYKWLDTIKFCMPIQTKEVIEMLLNNGAKESINTPTKDGWTPLS